MRQRGPQGEGMPGQGDEVLQLRQGRTEVQSPRDGRQLPDFQEKNGEQGRQDNQMVGGWILKVFQVNVGRGRVATDEVRRAAEEDDIDVVLLQEPYRCMPIWPGWIRYGGSMEDKAATMVRAKHCPIELTQFSGPNTRVVVIEDTEGEEVVFSNTYVPPTCNLGASLSKTERLLRDFRRKRVVIAGDFNAKHEEWGGQITDDRGTQLMDFVGAGDLIIANDRDSPPTFESSNGRSWVDVTLFRDTTLESWRVRDDGLLSDHKIISFRVRVDNGTQQRSGEKRMALGLADWGLFQITARATFDGRRDNQKGTAEEEAIFLQEAAMEACREAIPLRRRREGPKIVWWSGELNRKKKETKRARRAAQEEPDQERRREKMEIFKQRRSAYKKAIKEAKLKSLRETLEAGSPDDPWGLAHRILSASRKGAPTKWTTVEDGAGGWTKNRKETAAALIRKYFPQDEMGTDSPGNRETRELALVWNEDRDREISMWEIEEAIRGRPKRKAPGIDGFPTVALAHLQEAVGEEMARVFNNCLESGTFPKIWKEAQVAWLPKPNGVGLRPVCLLPTIGKIYDKILATRLAYFLEKNDRLSERQFGFRKGRGTTEALESAIDGIKKADSEGKHVLVVALDIRNAFNSAWYPRLKQLLASCGCPGDLARAEADFLDGRKVTSEGVTVETSMGCPQGSCLGPILWLLIMEEWFQEVDEATADDPETETKIQALADDQLVTITGTSLKKIEAAWEETWGACQRWAESHKLEYAPEKTTAIFRPARAGKKTRVKRQPRLRMGDTVIKPGESMKYLGIIIDRGLLWVEHSRYVAGKIAGAGHRVRAVAGRTWGTDRKVLKEIYNRAIKPSLLYGSEIWGERGSDSRVKKQLSKAQRPFLLGITKAYRTTSNAAVAVLAGCPPLWIEAQASHKKFKAITGRDFEGKPVFGLGPHPAEPRRRWNTAEEELTRRGRWIFSDASADQGNVAVGLVQIEDDVETGRQSRRLQEGYPVHMAELYALGIAARSIAGFPGEEVNLASDSKAALDLLVGRKGGTADRIERWLREAEEEGVSVRLWWVPDSIRGMALADQTARSAREEPDERPVTHAPITRRMLSREAQKVTMERWQADWNNEERGRTTQRYQKIVDTRLRGWNHKAVCLLTGHGPFRGYFRRFGLKTGTGECPCGEGTDTAEHAMEDCQLEARITARRNFRVSQMRAKGAFPFQVTKDTKDEEVGNFNRWATEIVIEEETEAIGGGNEADQESEEEEEEEEVRRVTRGESQRQRTARYVSEDEDE